MIGWEAKRLNAVIKTRIKGTRTTAHFVFLPTNRLRSFAWASMIIWAAESRKSSSSRSYLLCGGFGEGGGVNMAGGAHLKEVAKLTFLNERG